MSDLDALLSKMRAIVAALEEDNAHLRKENEELWTSVHELQDLANRAHTEDA